MVGQKVATVDIPSIINETFKAKFSIAEKISWSLDYDNFKAEFKVGKADFAATFDREGKWLKTESFLKPSELPKSIKDLLAKEFGELSAYKLDDVEKVETVDNVILYEMKVDKGELRYDISISEKGDILKKEVSEGR